MNQPTVVHSKDDKGVGVAYEIKPPKIVLIFPNDKGVAFRLTQFFYKNCYGIFS